MAFVSGAVGDNLSADRHPTPNRFSSMIRKAFVMSVNAGCEAEYERRHNPIWADLEAVLKSHGAHNYSIFLHPETRQLFGYVEIEDEARWASIAATPECQRWWKRMGDVMPSNRDNSPVSHDLREVFHLH
jgi:L-rhamnose mutarotase